MRNSWKGTGTGEREKRKESHGRGGKGEGRAPPFKNREVGLAAIQAQEQRKKGTKASKGNLDQDKGYERRGGG